MSSDTKDMEQLRRFIDPTQRVNIDKIRDLIGVSDGAAVALQLCRETLRDYCPPDEQAKVIAALIGLESHRRGGR